jgi:DNA-binding response OmpR family regulator
VAKTVLNVEDSEAARHVRTQILRREGLHVLEAGTVAMAMALADRFRFDVLLSDIRLPDGTGYSLARQLRNTYPDLRVVLISAVHTNDLAIQTGVYAGAAEYLVEPVTAAQLVAAVRGEA